MRPFIFACILACVAACSATPTRIAHVAVVSIGSAVTSLAAANDLVYTQQTDALRAELRAADASVATYDTRAAPLDHEFRARSAVLVSLDTSLYASAAIIDAVQSGVSLATMYEAARRLVVAIDTALAVLQSGAVMPAIRIPSEVTVAVAALRSLLGGTDGGVSDP